ncbi:MAG: LysR family transcriptional regulator [Methyloligellaceae bacterium]
MNKLRAIELFVRLADLGSFTRVADEFNSSKSFISKEISRLEEETGARLIHRSTRSLQLTEIGEGYLARCRKLLLQMEDADSFIQDMQGAPKGKLKVNAPMTLGLTDMGRAFADFMVAYPDIEIDMHLSDEPVDLIENGFDLGFRVASRQFDSQYIGKKICHFSYQICASPAYLEKHSYLKSPADLLLHNCFVYSYFRGGNVWPLEDGIQVKGNLRVNSTIFMIDCIRQGLGIGFLPDFAARTALRKGDIVEILAEHEKPQLTFYAMYPERQHVPPKLTHCIEFMQKWFRDSFSYG